MYMQAVRELAIPLKDVGTKRLFRQAARAAVRKTSSFPNLANMGSSLEVDRKNPKDEDNTLRECNVMAQESAHRQY